MSSALNGLTVSGTPVEPLPSGVHDKYPLPGKKGDYLGALIKVRSYRYLRRECELIN